MEYTNQKIQHGISAEDIRAGDYLLFIKRSYGTAVKRLETVEVACREMLIGKILTAPECGLGGWRFNTDLQLGEIYHSRCNLVLRVEMDDSDYCKPEKYVITESAGAW